MELRDLYIRDSNYRPEIYYDEKTREPIVVYRRVNPSEKTISKEFENNEPKIFKSNLKRKVAWVQDMKKRGGAELSNEVVTNVGIKCGNDVRLVTNQMSVDDIRKMIIESDLAVINNFFQFSKEQMEAVLDIVFTGKPYVKYEHDFRELNMRPKFAKELFGRSFLNVFISPLHRDKYRRELGVDGICLPLAIDVNFFKPVESIERKKNTALIFSKTKQLISDFIMKNRDILFTVVMDGYEIPISGSRLRVIDRVAYEEMPKLYSEHEYLVHFPVDYQAGDRVFFEAALCGCKVVANEKVGHNSWGFDLEDTEGLRNILRMAPFQFWREIDKRLN